MLYNYIKVGWRNMVKNRSVTLINFFGLAIGLTCSIALIVYILNEKSYDKFLPEYEKIYRVNTQFPDEDKLTTVTPNIVKPIFEAEFPAEIESVTRVDFSFFPIMVKSKEHVFVEKRIARVDSNFFDTFQYKPLFGKLKDALHDPYAVVLTASTANKYFGNANAVGEIIEINQDSTAFRVAAIIEDVNEKSHLKFDLAVAHRPQGYIFRQNTFNSANYYTYVKVKSPERASIIIDEFNEKTKKYAPEDEVDHANSLKFDLQPLQDIFLYSNHIEADTSVATSDAKMVNLMGVVAIMILIIAAINYVNLTTANSFERQKEVIMRKAVGAGKKHIFMQFIMETFIIVLSSFLLAFGLLSIALPWLGKIADRNLNFEALLSANLFWLPLVILVLITFLSGIYPAMHLASLNGNRKGNKSFRTKTSQGFMRRLLVIFQFVFTIIMISGVLIVYNQLEFLKNKKLGYDYANLVEFSFNYTQRKQVVSFKNALKQYSYVKNVSASTHGAYDILGGYSVSAKGFPEAKSTVAMAVDDGFIPTTNIKLLAGKNFSPGDENKEEYYFVVNESVIKLFGWSPEEAIGKEIDLHSRKGTIKGVMQDFHFASLHQKIAPLVLMNEVSYFRLMVKMTGNGGDLVSNINQFKGPWREIFGDYPFEFKLVEDQLDLTYQSERKMAEVTLVSTIFAIIIAVLGLYGLTLYNTKIKTKEIGIRKSFGASNLQIVRMVLSNFSKLIGIALLLAIPIANYINTEWLKTFAYQDKNVYWVYFATAIILVFLVFCTIGRLSWKAASINPSEALKYE